MLKFMSKSFEIIVTFAKSIKNNTRTTPAMLEEKNITR